MEKMLSPTGTDPRRDLIRENIKKCFKIRDCSHLVRPLDDESQLNTMGGFQMTNLRKAFQDGILRFENKVKS